MKNAKWLVVLLISFMLLASSVMLLRQPVLRYAIDKVTDKLKSKYGADLIVGNAGFTGFRDVYLEDVAVIPPNSSDTIFTLKSLKARISLMKLLKLKVGFKELIVDSVNINLVKADTVSNYRFLFKTKSDTAQSLNTVMGFNERLSSILDKVNNVFDEHITIRKFKVTYKNERSEELVSIPELYFDGKIFQSSIVTASNEGVNTWLASGVANSSKSEYNFSIRRTSGDAVALPFFDLVDGFKVCFDSAQVKFAADLNADVVPVVSEFNMTNLLVNHWRISPVDVIMPKLTFNATASFYEDSVTLEKGSVFKLKDLPINITVSHSRKEQKVYRLDMDFSVNDANMFFESLPIGMFNSLKGINTSGSLAYKLHFNLPLSNPFQLEFDSKLTGKNFRIKQYGTENFAKLNTPFSYLAMDGDRPVRSFLVGEGNPFFTPLLDVSPYLVNAVLTAEDPSFFNHAGFVEESFRESIATNIKKGRFARGGSTISMQLVKNVFLSRNKSVSRKLEEALIVWLIEQQRLVSKDRMFEVYLNIIEWGPNVYGIGEASRFYFDKFPRDLNLAESIYLASIIPHPKYFKYSFDTTGNFKPFMANYFKLVSGRLVKREKITQSEADSLVPFVKLTGEALNLVVPLDTIPTDTLDLIPQIEN
jgi:hypothetical protein